MSARTLQIATDALSTLDFTEAARRNSSDAHAVRQQLDKLQKALGADLLQRTEGKLGLTEPGKKAMHLGRNIMALLGKIESLKSELPSSRDIIGVAPDVFNALQQNTGSNRKQTLNHRRMVLDTSGNLKRRFDEKLLGMVVRYVHDYDVAENEGLRLPLIWAVSRDADDRASASHERLLVDLPPRAHPVHQAAINTLRKAGIAYAVSRELPEGMYLPAQRDALGQRHVLVPQFQLERLGLKAAAHPLLQAPVCVHIGIFSHREFFAVSDVEAFTEMIAASVRLMCGECSKPCCMRNAISGLSSASASSAAPHRAEP